MNLSAIRRPSPTSAVLAVALAALGLFAAPGIAAAHAPSVAAGNESPGSALVLDDPTLSRAIGATISRPGEVDWYRMDLGAGDALVVEMTAPDAAGGIPTKFTLLGPGLGSPGGDAAALAAMVGANGALDWAPEGESERTRHAGLGFIEYGGVRMTAPETGTYWIAVSAAQPGATGKYVLAPGVREAFGPGDVVGYAALATFFADPWPPDSGLPGWVGFAGVAALLALALVAVTALVVARRKRRRALPDAAPAP
jgi:hypothetical protein